MHQDLAPVFDRHRPAFRNLHGDQIQLLEQGVIADKRAFCLRDLAQLSIEVFDGVGRVDHPADRLRIFEHGGSIPHSV